jgi:hypothetical protein
VWGQPRLFSLREQAALSLAVFLGSLRVLA